MTAERLERLAPPRSVETVRDVVQRAIAVSTIRLVEAEPVVRAGDDPEGVHDARVAVRRLRSDLRTFGPVLDAERARGLRAELEWLADVIGPLREADVLHRRIRRRIDEGGDELAPAKVLVDELENRRPDGRRRLLEAIDSPRYGALLDALERAATDAPIVADADRPARRAGRLMKKPWRALDRRARDLGPDASDESLHAVRIRAKRVRYGAEALEPAFGKRAKRVASAAKKLQDILGEHQDAVVASAWLAEQALAADDAGVAFAAGRIAEQEVAVRARTRARSPRAVKDLRGRGPFWS
jgi:CHAD domain-containing protein